MKRMIAGAVAVAAVAGGTAVAATGDHKAAEQAVLSDAAKRLDVTAEELRSALAAAEDAQLDAAVKAGELTQAQADEIKAHRRADGTVLGLGPGGPGGPGGHHGGPGGHHGGGPMLMDDAAEALGISGEELFRRLQNGRSLARIARAEGKTLAQVKAAVKAAATERLDADLAAGRITQAQHDDMLEHLAEHVERLGEVRAAHGPKGPPPGRLDSGDSAPEDAVYRSA